MSKIKRIWMVVGLLVWIQIVYSFYYASEIVTQNDLMDKNLKKLEELKIDGEKLALRTAKMMSLETLELKIEELNLELINKDIN